MKGIEEFIRMKKSRGHRRPKYLTRKLSIGLVSCMLGYGLIMASIAYADEEGTNPPAVEEKDPKELRAGLKDEGKLEDKKSKDEAKLVMNDEWVPDKGTKIESPYLANISSSSTEKIELKGYTKATSKIGDVGVSIELVEKEGKDAGSSYLTNDVELQRNQGNNRTDNHASYKAKSESFYKIENQKMYLP